MSADKLIQLNADVGEGCANDAAIIPLVDTVNIACGGHAGDSDTIARTIAIAKQHGVSIGAHPSFPDREGFGRNEMQMSATELSDAISEQLSLIDSIARSMGYPISHIKPHGALYNMAARNRALAEQLITICKDFNADLTIVGLTNSELIDVAIAQRLKVMREGFADRRYLANGQLAARDRPGALIEQTDDALRQVTQILDSQSVTSIDNQVVPLHCDTLCLHGDGATALVLARSIADFIRSRRTVSDN